MKALLPQAPHHDCKSVRSVRFHVRLPEQATGSSKHRLDETVGCNAVDTRRQDDLFPQGALEDVVDHVGQPKLA